VFPLSLSTLIFCADPKVFIAIFQQTVKVWFVFLHTSKCYKKSDKIKKIPNLPTLFFSASGNTTLIFLGIMLKYKYWLKSNKINFDRYDYFYNSELF